MRIKTIFLLLLLYIFSGCAKKAEPQTHIVDISDINKNIIPSSIISTSIEATTLNLLAFSNIVGDFLILVEFDKLVDLFEITIGIFLIFSIFALLIRYKGKNEHFKDFYILLKSGLILILGLFYLTYLFRLEFIYTDDFYSLLIVRCLETFAPFIILLAGIALEQTFKISNKFIDFLISSNLLFLYNREKLGISRDRNTCSIPLIIRKNEVIT